jgi:uncharacterized repeat protein (TIGR03803 family)
MVSKYFSRALGSAFLILMLATPSFAASKFKILYNFSNGSGGAGPAYGLVFDKTGNLYGMAYGGTKGYGLVFELSPQQTGWAETVLHNFDFYVDGELPVGILTFDPQGNLYGVTSDGPNINNHLYAGVVFELSPGSASQWTESILCMFDSGTPKSGYVRDQAGNLYGNNDFTDELSPLLDGKWKHRTIAQASSIFSAATLKDGNLYDAGGAGKYGYGMVYELTPAKDGSWQQIDLYDFKGNIGGGSDGYYPTAGVVFDGKGNVYGATVGGGIYSNACYAYGKVNGCGTVYKLTPTAHGQWKETVLHRFDYANNGFGPGNTLTIDKAGNLYGVAVGGNNACQNGCGLIFKLSPTKSGKWKYSVVHTFTDAKDDGAWPDTTMVFDKQQKHLYGTTLYGGTYNSGIVFELTP